MRYFRTPDGEIMAIDNGQDGLIGNDWSEMTDEDLGSAIYPKPTLDDLAARQRNVIDTARDAAIDAGFTHLFGSTKDVAQTRARDRENITGLAVSAQLMLTNGDTTSTLPFRAQSDTTYHLTAQQIVDLAQAAQRHISAQYVKAWDLKDQIETARKAGDRETMEAIAW